MKTRIIVTLFCSIIAGNVLAATFSEALGVYSRIQAANNLDSRHTLLMDKSLKVNAFNRASNVIITMGMLLEVRNNHELALVLGHELGHDKLNHGSSIPSNEFSADREGALMADRAGYNHCVGADLVRRIHSPAGKTHPASDERYKRLRRGC